MKLSLMEHLGELRSCLIHCLAYLSVGTTLGWFLYDRAFVILAQPLKDYLGHGGAGMIQTDILGGFTLKMQVSALLGLLMFMPFVVMEIWGFVSPGLTRAERKGALCVAPLSVLLFWLGVYVAYAILPTGVSWLLAQNAPGVAVMLQVQSALLFVLKMALAFGLVFQLPVVLMFMARIGVVDSGMLIRYWRHAIVVVSVAAAVITPSGDAFSMCMMAAPMVVLYFLSIALVRLVERRR